MHGEAEQLVLGHAVGVDATLGRLRAHGVDVDAPAVVGDRDDHLGPELHGVQPDRCLGRLARGLALRGRFDAVVDGVAHEVQQRVGQLVQHATVELGVAAPHVPADLLVLGTGQVTHSAVQLVGDGGDGHHASAHRPVLQLVHGPGQVVELCAGRRVDAELIFEHASQAKVRGGRFADQANQLVQALHRHHHQAGLLAGRRPLLRNGLDDRFGLSHRSGLGPRVGPVPDGRHAGHTLIAGDDRAQPVGTGEQDVDDIRRHGAPLRAQVVEELLEFMRAVADVVPPRPTSP